MGEEESRVVRSWRMRPDHNTDTVPALSGRKQDVVQALLSGPPLTTVDAKPRLFGRTMTTEVKPSRSQGLVRRMQSGPSASATESAPPIMAGQTIRVGQ